MAAVLHLVRKDNTETQQALQYLADEAKGGRIVGVALCFLTSEGEEEAVFSGIYKAHPAKAVNAAMRLSWLLTQMQDSGPP